MKITTRHTCYGIEIKVDEISTDIYKNSGESEHLIHNLLETLSEVCRMEDQSMVEHLENYFGIQIMTEE